MPKKYTTVAICYDFDGTLAKGNIQETSFIPEIGMKKRKFWKEVREMVKDDEMDEVLAYMFLLIDKAKAEDVSVTRDEITKHGEKVKFFEGVEEFFGRINEYARNKEIKLEHYIISSGTKEMIEGTTIAKEFKNIFACSFKYDRIYHAPLWPAHAINFTTKVQYLFRINKGIDNAWDDSQINQHQAESDRPIPFSRMIYIGDGETDVPAMKMVNYKGGTTIAVYGRGRGAKKRVEETVKDGRAKYIAKADYSEGKEIDTIISAIIDQISADESIKKYQLGD